MTPDTVAIVCARLQARNRHALELARLLSLAARIEPVLIRHMRLHFLRDSDVSAEAELWFSALVETRSGEGIRLASGAAAVLRRELTNSSLAVRARNEIRKVHANASPLVELEEEVTWLALSGASDDEINRRLSSVLATMEDQPGRDRDLSAWALGALRRLPEAATRTTAGQALKVRASAQLGVTIELTPGELNAIVESAAGSIPASVPDVGLVVEREGPTKLHFREANSGEAYRVAVPDTHPRIVEVVDGTDKRVIVFEAGRGALVTFAGDVVLRNLRGSRWRLRTDPIGPATSRSKPPESKPENGFWILVDGTDHYELSPHEYEMACALGAALARAGFTLVTLGRQGVAHVVAQNFWQVLEEQKLSSGISRIVNVVSRDTPSDFKGGRSVFPSDLEDVIGAATRRADALLRIGTSGAREDLDRAARRAGLRVEDLASLADVSSVSAALLQAFAVPAASDADLPAALLLEAARALDAQDLNEYNRLFRLVERGAADLPRETILHAVVDPRRPTRRLVGYAGASRDLPADVVLRALEAERETLRSLAETRTLWLALECLDALHAIDETHEQALAAMCVTIEAELVLYPLADEKGSCTRLLQRIKPRLQRIEPSSRYTSSSVASADEPEPASPRATDDNGVVVEELMAAVAEADYGWHSRSELIERIAAAPSAKPFAGVMAALVERLASEPVSTPDDSIVVRFIRDSDLDVSVKMDLYRIFLLEESGDIWRAKEREHLEIEARRIEGTLAAAIFHVARSEPSEGAAVLAGWLADERKLRQEEVTVGGVAATLLAFLGSDEPTICLEALALSLHGRANDLIREIAERHPSVGVSFAQQQLVAGHAKQALSAITALGSTESVRAGVLPIARIIAFDPSQGEFRQGAFGVLLQMPNVDDDVWSMLRSLPAWLRDGLRYALANRIHDGALEALEVIEGWISDTKDVAVMGDLCVALGSRISSRISRTDVKLSDDVQQRMVSAMTKAWRLGAAPAAIARAVEQALYHQPDASCEATGLRRLAFDLVPVDERARQPLFFAATANLESPPAWARGLIDRIILAAPAPELYRFVDAIARLCPSTEGWPATVLRQMLDALRKTMGQDDLTKDLAMALGALPSKGAVEVILAWFERSFPGSPAVAVARREAESEAKSE